MRQLLRCTVLLLGAWTLSACNQSSVGNPANPNPYAGGAQYPWAQQLENLTSYALKTGFLSDQSWVSATSGWGPVELDASNGEQAQGDGRTIKLGGQSYQKGLGAHADSRIQYDLSSTCTRFKADVGLDDEVRYQTEYGSVVFQVWSGAVKLYDSGAMTTTSPTKKIDLDVTNRNELVLIVNHVGDNNWYDHADWADARVECGTKPPTSGARLVFTNITEGQTLSGNVYSPGVNVIRGTASDLKLEFRKSDGTGGWINTFSATPACLIGACNWWNTTKVANGSYYLKATVTVSGGQVLVGQVNFSIKNRSVTSPPPPSPTPPGPPPSPPPPTPPSPPTPPPPSPTPPPAPPTPPPPSPPTPPPAPPTPPPPSPGIKLPPTGKVSWDWQIGAGSDSGVVVPAGVTLMDVDGFDISASKVAEMKQKGIYTVCYLDVGSYEGGNSKRPDWARYTDALKLYPDPNWPDEIFLDITEVFKPNSVLAGILRDRFKMCKDKGFDAVEPDNLQNDENIPGGIITKQQQIDFNGWVADTVHQYGLAVFQKNGPDNILKIDKTGKMMVEKFDGILNEQCQEYTKGNSDECSPLAEYTKLGKLALNVEYKADTNLDCPLFNGLQVNPLKKDKKLVGVTQSGYKRETCN